MIDADFDVAVIGAGVNGSGVARDASLRGLKVALLERNDIGFGASGNSSGMIHGGPRYLSHNPDVTRSSCLDSGHIQHIAPHLLFRIPFLVPVYDRGPLSRMALTLYDAFFDLYDDYQPLKHGKPHARLSSEELRSLEPGLIETAGGVTFDEWGIDGVRLCVANVVDAVEHGARFFNHTTLTRLESSPGGGPHRVHFRHRSAGGEQSLTARLVVNATGAWSPITAGLGQLGEQAVRLRPGKGIHVFLDRRLTNYAVVTNAIDGRQVFLMPWQNMSVLGTTDDDFYGNPDEVFATPDEVRYLFQAIFRVFPSISQARAIGTWAGVRPTIHGWGVNEDELSREHQVIDHGAHGAPFVFSMVGGKLASYRLFAEEMTDILARKLGNSKPGTTHLLPLPGGDESVDPLALSLRAGIEPLAAARLEYRHGSRSLRVLEAVQRDPQQSAVVCPCEPVTEAEIRYVVAHEWAEDVEDVSRRTRLGLGACGGMRCALRAGRIVAEARGQSPEAALEMAEAFLAAAARRRVVALDPVQARQEALALATLRAARGEPR